MESKNDSSLLFGIVIFILNTIILFLFKEDTPVLKKVSLLF